MFQTFISRHNSNFFSDKLVLTSVTPASSAPVLQTPKATSDRKSGSAGMPRPISYAVFCLKKKKKERDLSKSLVITAQPATVSVIQFISTCRSRYAHTTIHNN